MRKIALVQVVAALLALGVRPALASDSQSPSPGREELIFESIPDVWSATRTIRSPLDVPNEVTIITGDDIRESGATSIVELLESVPALELMRVSRADVNVSIRGFNPLVSSRVLAMIDGRPVNIDFTGIVLWESLNVQLQEIKRIEVIRGPGSVLYGANALMGVVNIITKRPHEMPAMSVHAGFGPKTSFASVSGARATERASFKSSIKYQALKHFRNKSSPFRLEPRTRDKTAQRFKQGNATFEYLFGDGTNVSLSGGATLLDQDIGTQLGDFRLGGTLLYFGKVNIDSGLWRFQSFFNGLASDLDSVGSVFPPPFPAATPLRSDLHTSTFDVEVQRTHPLGDHTFLWGLNVRRVATRSKEFFGGSQDETLYGAFLQDEFPLGDRLLLLSGIRFDQLPKAGLHVSPRLSAVVKLGPAQRLRFLWTRSFRAPSHLYNYAKVNIPSSNPTALAPTVPVIPPFRFQGDQGLDSVTMDSWEVGYRASYGEKVRFNATVYLNALRDFHALTRPNPADTFLFGVKNTSHTKAWGTELSAEFRLNDHLHGFASYHFETARGDLQRTTPANKVILGLRGWLVSWLRYSLTTKYVAHTNYDTDNVDASFIGDTSIPSRFNVDGYLGVKVRPDIEIGVKARNIFHQVRRQFPLGDEIGSEVVATIRVEY